MIIKTIRTKAHQGYEIETDDGQSFSVSEDTLVAFQLHKGQTINQELREELARQDEYYKTLNRALGYLYYSNKTTKQMKDYLLRKKFEEDVIDQVIEELQQRKLIDDVAMAKAYVEQFRLEGRYGNKMIRQKLLQKGISANIISRLDLLSAKEEREALRSLAQKKWPSIKGDDNFQKCGKLARFLYSRGFSSKEIWAVVEDYRHG